MYYFILKSILGSIVGSSFYTWWQDTRMGVWFQKKLNDTLDALDWEVLKKEEKWKKAYPNLALQMEEILAERERLITRVERLEGAMDILVPERRQGAD